MGNRAESSLSSRRWDSEGSVWNRVGSDSERRSLSRGAARGESEGWDAVAGCGLGVD